MRPLIVPLLCGFFAARAFGAPPSAVPTTLPSIPAVFSLEDLRALPPIQAGNGWEARVGIADGGRESGPWKVIYCLAKPAGEGAMPSPNTSESLGPFAVEFDRAPQGCPVIVKMKENVVRARRVHRNEEVLFARVIPMASKGKWELTLSPASSDSGESLKPLLRSHFEVAESARLYWQQFAGIERFQDEHNDTRFRYVAAADPFAALPQTDSDADLLPTTRPIPARGDNKPQMENRLPGGVPLLGGWAGAISGVKDPAALDVPPLALSLVDGWFVVQSPGPEMLDRADHRLLARWWVNGEPIAAPPAKHMGLKEARLLRMTKEIRVRFGLPATLGQLKSGDRVALQVLYTPKDLEPVFDGLEQKQQQMQLQSVQGEANCLLPSNRIEFVISEQMLRERK